MNDAHVTFRAAPPDPLSLRAWGALLAAMGCLALALGTPVLAQWSTQSPLPTHLEVRGVAAPAPGRVFLATDDDSFDASGALFESNDGGGTWVQRNVPESLGDGLNGLFFLDAQLGWVWGNSNYRTTDGGTTWEPLPLLGSAYFMEFYSASFGVTTGNFGAYVSRDGGLTWTPSPEEITSFDFADALTGLGVAGTGHLPHHRWRRHLRPGAGRRGRRRDLSLADRRGGDRRRRPCCALSTVARPGRFGSGRRTQSAPGGLGRSRPCLGPQRRASRLR